MIKRNILLASLAALCTVTAGLVAASPASADVECRYLIPIPPNPDPPVFTDNVVVFGPDTGIAPHNRGFGVQQPRWSVVGVRPSAGANYDLQVRDCDDGVGQGRLLAESALVGSAVDFVAIDGNRAWPAPPGDEKSLYASIFRGRARGTFMAEYSNNGPALVVGAAQSLFMRGTPALVRDLYVPSGGTATIELRLDNGDADLALVDSTGFEGTWARSRHQAIRQSTNPGLTTETITISLSPREPGRTFGVVVINNAEYGQYYLSRF